MVRSMKKILLVEDDMMIASGLLYALESEGYAPTHCKSVQTALSAAETQRFDLAILDMQLPDGTGFEISRKLRGTGTAVIFLTFEGGAADYITKPFRLRELLARVKRTLSAGIEGAETQMLTIGEVRIDIKSGKVYVPDGEVVLTALEYRLLLTFAANPARLLTRGQILESIWDSGGNFVEDNTLTVYVKRLREKLGGALSIETVRGIGYRAD